MSDNPTIQLQTNSLYIATNQILTPGKFHWVFYYTDSDGNISKLDWAEVPRSGFTGKAEAIRVQRMSDLETYSADNIVTYAFFRIAGFDASFETLREIAERAFPEDVRTGFSTIKENREAGLTCRTFLLRIIAILKEEGYLQREEPPALFETEVNRVSSSVEQEMADGKFEKSIMKEI